MVKGNFEQRIEDFEWKKKAKRQKLEKDMYGGDFQPHLYQRHKDILF